jgi:S1-C subfamily serine protease
VKAAAAACVAAALLAPSVAAAPPRPPQVVAVAVAQPVGPPDAATGFVAGDGLVMTVAHVLERGGVVTVDGRRATAVRVDRRLDLALLRVPGVRGAPDRTAAGGHDTSLLGRPAPLVRRISARVDGAGPRPALELRADVAAGESGAPVVTAAGRLAGIVFARSQDRAGVAYAVDASAVGALLSR